MAQHNIDWNTFMLKKEVASDKPDISLEEFFHNAILRFENTLFSIGKVNIEEYKDEKIITGDLNLIKQIQSSEDTYTILDEYSLLNSLAIGCKVPCYDGDTKKDTIIEFIRNNFFIELNFIGERGIVLLSLTENRVMGYKILFYPITQKDLITSISGESKKSESKSDKDKNGELDCTPLNLLHQIIELVGRLDPLKEYENFTDYLLGELFPHRYVRTISNVAQINEKMNAIGIKFPIIPKLGNDTAVFSFNHLEVDFRMYVRFINDEDKSKALDKIEFFFSFAYLVLSGHYIRSSKIKNYQELWCCVNQIITPSSPVPDVSPNLKDCHFKTFWQYQFRSLLERHSCLLLQKWMDNSLDSFRIEDKGYYCFDFKFPFNKGVFSHLIKSLNLV